MSDTSTARDLFSVHSEEHRPYLPPISLEKCSPPTRLHRKPTPKPGREFAVVFEGVQYLRAARNAAQLAIPRASTHERCKAILGALQVATGKPISMGTVENILYPDSTVSSIRAEYLVPIIGFAASQGVNTMAIPGAPEVLKFMVGKNVMELVHRVFPEAGEYSQVIDGCRVTVSIEEVPE